MHSAVLITPAALRDKANALGDAMGFGPETYTVPLSSDGETTTHWGAHAVVQPSFIATILAAGQGQFPPIDWASHGLTPADVGQVLASLVISAPGSELDMAQFVDVNAADADRLQSLPGVGPALSAAIIAGRPWGDLAALMAIQGIGPATVASWSGQAIAGPRAAPDASVHFEAVLERQGWTRI